MSLHVLFATFLTMSQVARSHFIPLSSRADDDSDELQKTAQNMSWEFDIPGLSRPDVTKTILLPDLPEACSDNLGDDEECTTSMNVVNVTYTDSSSPNANTTMDEAIDSLASVPVALRQYVGTVMLMPGDVAHAYTWLNNGETHYFGVNSIHTWIHEASHAFDGANAITSETGDGTFSAAVDADTCVPDTYAVTSIVEDFAQLSVIIVYALANNYTLPAGYKADCMAHQIYYILGLPAYEPATLFGGD
ncbi:hypothetical protein BDZ89DRAFT_1075675 [Hymenopellis radicata]|nr:hypothetical protein BDZ89DRAFT_1075675 [Hymenopellis radicata]